MERKLVAALACRVTGSRLYGKPLQTLDPERRLTILEHIVATFRSEPVVSEIALAIADGAENAGFARIAERLGLSFVHGDPEDVLPRFVACARNAGASDVIRVTSECPFLYFEGFAEGWNVHCTEDNDITALDGLPEGGFFEIFTLAALECSLAERAGDDVGEAPDAYALRRRDRFRVSVLRAPEPLRRPDLRVTVDYPEDLYVCREIFREFSRSAPRIPFAKIIEFLDRRNDLTALLAPYGPYQPVWT